LGIFDYDSPPTFSLDQIEPRLPGYWRYRSTFDLVSGAPLVTLGEGNTPLLWDEYGKIPIGLKMESMNPTGSYKDRGSAVLVSQLLGRQVGSAVEDSSGNAGASFAAYAAHGGLTSRIYVPASASGPKRQQIEMYGAELVSIPGPRSQAAEAVLAEAEKGTPYASHAYLPFGLMGIATIAYEIWDQLDRKAPGTVIAPVGHGGLLLGIVRGFSALKNGGCLDQPPYYLGVQAAVCDPVVQAFRHGLDIKPAISDLPSLAEGARVSKPVRARALLQEISPQQGNFISVEEADLRSAFCQLAQRGYYVEPTSALVWAVLEEQIQNLPQPIVAVLTGLGLKYQSSK
jgi:threonine synthase